MSIAHFFDFVNIYRIVRGVAERREVSNAVGFSAANVRKCVLSAPGGKKYSFIFGKAEIQFLGFVHA